MDSNTPEIIQRLLDDEEGGDHVELAMPTTPVNNVPVPAYTYEAPSYESGNGDGGNSGNSAAGGLIWKNSRAIGADLPSPSAVPAFVSQARLTAHDPFANTAGGGGPRSIRIPRNGAQGFGFMIGGAKPCNAAIITANGPAQVQGLVKGDELLEVNGVDATNFTLSEVAEIIQAAGEHLTLVVIPGVDAGANGIQVLFGSALEEGMMTGAVDPTQRPSNHMAMAGASVVCCPIVGSGAVYHAMMVRGEWAAGHFTKARIHSLMAKKLAANAVFYGIVLIALYFMMTAKPKGHNMND